MVKHSPEIAAEWWEHHSGSKMGKQYADIIRSGGDGHNVGLGQMAALVRKGSVRGIAAGLSLAGRVSDEDRPKRGRRKKG